MPSMSDFPPAGNWPSGKSCRFASITSLSVSFFKIHGSKMYSTEIGRRERGTNQLKVLEDGGLPLADLFAQEAATGPEPMKAQQLHLLLLHRLLTDPPTCSFHLRMKNTPAR